MRMIAGGLRRPVRAAGVALGLLLPAALAQVEWDADCDEFWDGGCSPPMTPEVNLTNWDTDGIPGPMDDVFIGAAFSVVGNVDIELAGIESRSPLRVQRGFQISSYADVDHITIECDPGNVQVGGLLETGGQSVWKSGNITAGQFENVGTLALEGNTAALIATTFENKANVNSGGARELRNGAQIVNTGTWTVASQNASLQGGLADGSVLFRTTGKLARTGSGTAVFEVPVEASGDLEMSGGTLALSYGARIDGLKGELSNNSRLELRVPTGREVRFTGSSTMASRGSPADLAIIGPGPTRFDGSLVASLDDESPHGFFFANGSEVIISGTAANWAGSRAEWEGTSVSGAGEYSNRGELHLRSADLAARLRVTGTGNVFQNGTLRLEDGGAVCIEDGGVWSLSSGNVTDGGGINVFKLGGELLKPIESLVSSEIEVPLVTDGQATVRVAGEALHLRGGGELGGTLALEAATGGLLSLANSTFTSGAGGIATVSGPGGVRLGMGARWELLRGSDRVRLQVTSSESSGFSLDGGTLAAPGGGLFENYGNVVWTTGTIAGGDPGASSPQGFLNVDGAQVLIASRATLDGSFTNQGHVAHSSGALTITSGGQFRNQGTYALTGTSGLQGDGQFLNRCGTLVARGGSHTVSCPVVMGTGRVEVDGGTLTMSNLPDAREGDTLKAGTWIVRLTGTLHVSGPTIRRLQAPASVRLNGGLFPNLDLEVIEPGATFENTSDGLLDGDLRNSGWLKVGALLEAPSLRNEEFGELAAMVATLEDTPGGSGFTSGVKTSAGFENAGHALPGGAGEAGYLPVTGDFAQATTGVLHIELAGATNTPGVAAQFDQLAVSGVATLDGLAAVTITADFAAAIAPGDQFTIVRAVGGVIGTFANGPAGGRLFTADRSGSFALTYGPDEVVLSGYRAETPPAPATIPHLTIERGTTSDSIILTLTGDPGRLHRLDATADLDTWNPLRDAVPNLSGRFRTTHLRDPAKATELLRWVVPEVDPDPEP